MSSNYEKKILNFSKKYIDKSKFLEYNIIISKGAVGFLPTVPFCFVMVFL